jgi:hypothetical protein
MTPLFVGKAIYRLHKRGSQSVGWYEWLYEGNREFGLGRIAALHEYAVDRGIDLRVVLLPAGVAYENGTYRLAWIHEEIGGFLAARGIPYQSPIEEFSRDPGRYFDATDHLQDAGNALMAEVMAQLLEEPRAPRA